MGRLVGWLIQSMSGVQSGCPIVWQSRGLAFGEAWVHWGHCMHLNVLGLLPCCSMDALALVLPHRIPLR